jgi:hypothetical protein
MSQQFVQKIYNGVGDTEQYAMGKAPLYLLLI